MPPKNKSKKVAHYIEPEHNGVKEHKVKYDYDMNPCAEVMLLPEDVHALAASTMGPAPTIVAVDYESAVPVATGTSWTISPTFIENMKAVAAAFPAYAYKKPGTQEETAKTAKIIDFPSVYGTGIGKSEMMAAGTYPYQNYTYTRPRWEHLQIRICPPIRRSAALPEGTVFAVEPAAVTIEIVADKYVCATMGMSTIVEKVSGAARYVERYNQTCDVQPELKRIEEPMHPMLLSMMVGYAQQERRELVNNVEREMHFIRMQHLAERDEMLEQIKELQEFKEKYTPVSVPACEGRVFRDEEL